MKKPLLYAFTLTALGGCFYTETPYGRTAVLDLPVHSHTPINNTATAIPTRLTRARIPRVGFIKIKRSSEKLISAFRRHYPFVLQIYRLSCSLHFLFKIKLN